MNEKKGKGGIRVALEVVVALVAIGGLVLGLCNKGQIERTNRIAEYTAKPNITMCYAVSKIRNFQQEFKEHLKGKSYHPMPNSYYIELRDIGEEERLLWLVFENKGPGCAEKIYIPYIAYNFGNERPRSIRAPTSSDDPLPNPRYGEIPNRVLESNGIAVLLVEILKCEPEYVNKQLGFVNYLEDKKFFETFKADISLHDISTGSPKSEPLKTGIRKWSDLWPHFEEYTKKGSGKHEQKKY